MCFYKISTTVSHHVLFKSIVHANFLDLVELRNVKSRSHTIKIVVREMGAISPILFIFYVSRLQSSR